jgi:hypothetical protein
MPNPLPQFVSSLSKYIRVEKYYRLIASIAQDTPEAELRVRFDRDLYATAKQRYLTVRDGTVLRDKLVDLVHQEGRFTGTVKTVMYFTFMFRDARYRQFICDVVGKNAGRWDTSVFRGKDLGYFEDAGGHKALTNLRQLLFQTGVLDKHSLAMTLSRALPIHRSPRLRGSKAVHEPTVQN